jgi:hypothetical protein
VHVASIIHRRETQPCTEKHGNPQSQMQKSGPDIQNTGHNITNKYKFIKIIVFHTFLNISMYFHVFHTSLLHFCMVFNVYVLSLFKMIEDFLNFSSSTDLKSSWPPVICSVHVASIIHRRKHNRAQRNMATHNHKWTNQ